MQEGEALGPTASRTYLRDDRAREERVDILRGRILLGLREVAADTAGFPCPVPPLSKARPRHARIPVTGVHDVIEHKMHSFYDDKSNE